MGQAKEPKEVMTLAEVASYLQLAERTVLRMAQRGEIPGAKIASQWRFMRSVVRDWLAGQMQTMPTAKLVSASWRENSGLALGEFLRPELMNLDLRPGPKESVLRQLVAPLRASGFARNGNRLLAGLIERERMMTTAIGHAIALPHPRRPIANMFAEPAVALGICRSGTDFNAVDDQLVHLFFLICATRDEIHLQLMARISWMTRQDGLLVALQTARTPEQVTEAIAKSGLTEPSSNAETSS